ncbi:T9SS sorting signal type C domain-containing protein [uncultured Winogradskyella sp.]|uniref:T9SS sorting signal type C domain-containing protein n=1 Tax=uncultured Winogradskyella sp. TaxID=395353 RepID=UPI00262421B9|nr:T9SS sorting signal type C domain-containing protein [uncultured Winogradskyella sp.]
MKNTLHSPLFRLFNFCIKVNKKTLVLLLFGSLLLASTNAYAQLPVSYDFESGLQGWTDGGSDAGRTTGSNWSCGGTNNSAIFSKDNDTGNNRMTSPIIDLSSYTEVIISFCHKSQRIDNGEGFNLEFFDGTSWNTVRTYARGTDFTNNGQGNPHSFSETILSSTYNFSASSRFRFSGTANDNNEYNYFDDVVITEAGGALCSEPADQPTNLSFNSVTETTMNMSFTAATSSPDGYLVLYNTTGTTPTINDTTTYTIGSTFSGNTVLSNNSDTSFNITGLTNNTTYHFYVFSFNSACSGGPDYLTTSPLTDNITTDDFCSPTTINGTSDLACPSVDAGGLGLSGGDPTVDCYYEDTVIEANYLELGDTSSYDVESIAYNPPYQFGCLANPVSVNLDDVFSPVVNLPFDFCFYGNTYNSCVIGSNGVISFDTSLANGPSGWRMLYPIPNAENARDYNSGTNTYFFGPSIYGVHHDVDPSIGGEIGYQLITLDTGCQALVTAWKDVPMYLDNSILYSGMMVFYEDTNVIEIYIEEKNLDPTWNNERASVGLQANATVATVPPGRNTNSTDWSVSQEAWRFVPSGASITDLKWYQNSISAANEIIDPNDDGEITVNPAVTTTYFSEVTYTLCNGSTIVESDATTVTVSGNKTWNGSVSTAWENANNWTPVGVPISSDCITIPVTANDPIMLGTTDGVGYNMEILDGALLTQQSNSSLTIEDDIRIEPNGDLEVRDSASVIQIIDVTTNKNDGSARVQRKVDGLNSYDYVYWSSPVDLFDVEDISPGSSNSLIYNWEPTVANGTAGEHGTWINTSENMIPGKGYIIRGLIGTSIANTAEFSGTINNGKISFPISRGTWTGADYVGIGNTATAEDDNWNLLGNPYPSAISLKDFVDANPTIDGTLYFWRHLNAASAAINDPFYENYAYNYNDSDYIAANSFGSSPPGFNDYIASGQGFFALMLDSATTPNTVNFDNTMRGVYANDGFYRDAPGVQSKHRIWLDLVGEDNTALSILVGFADGASDNMDRLYDGISINKSENQFYSVLSDQKLTIQAKALPFEDSKTIALGYQTSNPGGFTISINQLDGLFVDSNQSIYVEDKELNIIHDLRANPYSFTTESGTFNERFVLRFNNTTLGIKDQDIITDLRIRSVNNTIDAISSLSVIKKFEVFDITGRTIHKNINVNNTSYIYQTNGLSEGTYIVQVLLANGAIVSKKVII